MPEDRKHHVKKFSDGANVGQNWLEWLKEEGNEARLREAYDSAGMKGVTELLKLCKSQCYELIAKLRWRREKIERDNRKRAVDYSQKLYIKRRKHLFEHYGWVPGMNCCFVKSFEKFYHGAFVVGRKQIAEHCWVCVSSLPFLAVRNYMRKHGLQYYVMKYGVVKVEEVADNRSRWIVVRQHRLGPPDDGSREYEQWADEETAKTFSVLSGAPPEHI